MASDNLFEAYGRLEASAARLDRIVFDDPDTHAPGLMTRIERLNGQLDTISAELQAIKRRRPNISLWVAGYIAFLVSGAFAMVAFYSLPEIRAALDLPGPVAVAMAVLFAAAALVLFVAGYGWFDQR
jgi:CHASE2 domain-containing sensor protein